MKSFYTPVKEELTIINNSLSDLINVDNEVLGELADFLNGPSKRIRSVVILLYLKSLNISITKDIYDVLVSTELIHNASLLHDDVIDNASTRRGKTTIGEKFSPHISILLGDYLLSIAIEKLTEINNRKISEMFLNTAKKMSQAEIKQYLLRGSTPTLKDYIDICKGKTAGLFSVSFESTALLADIDCEIAKKFGEVFGILFQINNDINKDSAEADKKNNTRTILSIEGIEKTNSLKDNYKEELRSYTVRLPNNLYRKGLEDLIELL